jgi:hypothetical protein
MRTLLRASLVDMVSDAEPKKHWKSTWMAVVDTSKPLPKNVWDQCEPAFQFMCDAIHSDIQSAEGSGATALDEIRRIETGEVDKIESDGNARIAYVTRDKARTGQRT